MKRTFKLICGDTDVLEGYLYYDTDTKQFSMSAVSAPFDDIDCFFERLQKRNMYEVPQHIVESWVDSRLSSEQGVSEYNRFELLLNRKAKCSMDTTYMEEI